MKAIILDMYGVIVKQTGDEFVHYLVINAGRRDFNHPVRRTAAALIIQLCLIADYRNISF